MIKRAIIRGRDLAEALHDLMVIAEDHDLEILVIEPLVGNRGRPRAQVDFVGIVTASESEQERRVLLGRSPRNMESHRPRSTSGLYQLYVKSRRP